MVLSQSLRKRLEQLEIYLTHLDEMKNVGESEFLADWKVQDIILRNLQITIESCIDIGAHIISQKGLNVPDTYVGVIDALAKEGILPADFSERFKDLVKLRNIIVHEYLYLDYKKVYKNLNKISEIRGYIKFVVEYLELGQKNS